MESLGQWLREERESRNVSIEEIASATKIVPRYLEALEDDRLDRMPGGFFVKGIIRTYARAIGLDPDEVLERYRSAGLVGGPEQGRALAPPLSGPPLPLGERGQEPVAPRSPAGIVSLPEAEPPPAKEGSPLVFEDTSRPGLGPEARRKILAWTARGLAVLVIGAAVFFVLRSVRSPRGPGPGPETSVAETRVPPAPRTEIGTNPATGEPEPGPAASTKAAAPPASEAVESGVAIEIEFQAETWIRVYADGELKIDGLFPAGATARARAEGRLLIHTGNAGGFTFRLNGRPAKPLGRPGQVLTDVRITPETLKDFLEAPSLPPGPSPA